MSFILTNHPQVISSLKRGVKLDSLINGFHDENIFNMNRVSDLLSVSQRQGFKLFFSFTDDRQYENYSDPGAGAVRGELGAGGG